MHHQLNQITVKLFRYFDTHFKGVEQRFAEQDRHIEGLYKVVDAYIQQSETKLFDRSADDLRLIRLEQKVVSLSRQTRNRTLPR